MGAQNPKRMVGSGGQLMCSCLHHISKTQILFLLRTLCHISQAVGAVAPTVHVAWCPQKEECRYRILKEAILSLLCMDYELCMSLIYEADWFWVAWYINHRAHGISVTISAIGSPQSTFALVNCVTDTVVKPLKSNCDSLNANSHHKLIECRRFLVPVAASKLPHWGL